MSQYPPHEGGYPPSRATRRRSSRFNTKEAPEKEEKSHGCF
ncbi:7649f3ca-89a5-49f4-834c-60361ea38e0e [Thermothielavioides terrestris]|uniref:7649f3ca-89a5-49f4-834c-60361ea38e0e n=1 Tax=Thermothielavioides terrestris TaxID=2587410 RepID=A0A3S4APM4_9PEZI|nr:7649f3ca-89a5-49f4-834c-60361ea38e0e [Thermothielavioides terrestris]